MLIRHLLVIAALPFSVMVLVPYWIAHRYGIELALSDSPIQLLLQAGGLAALATGAVFFVSSVLRFAHDGRGTLAPWDPPSRLVVTGLYRYVRNPMISGVVLVLLGEAMILRSLAHLIWAVLFLGTNAVIILTFEEPRLLERFGSEYEAYRSNVPRLIPRFSAWTPGEP